ncbi:MAG: thiazole biosynthesis protein [Planctomycetes bacterium]|nr:thiazole biosynthesis protein [Planctomycetota bacterium]
MEEKISGAIVDSFFTKLKECLSLDVAVVGAGPSGLIAAHDLALAGRKVAVFERKLAPGGGIWGGGMLFNELVFRKNALEIASDFNIRTTDAGDGCYTADAVEVAAALIFGAVHAGAHVFNSVSVEDIVFKDGKVCGVVINWTPITRLEMHVDPLVITAGAVLDGTGHPSEIARKAADKAGVTLDTPTGKVMGERPMWVESGEASTVENTKMICPGLYVSGMAANNVSGGFRMGPIFGGMFLSGRKVAGLIAEGLDAR